MEFDSLSTNISKKINRTICQRQKPCKCCKKNFRSQFMAKLARWHLEKMTLEPVDQRSLFFYFFQISHCSSDEIKKIVTPTRRNMNMYASTHGLPGRNASRIEIKLPAFNVKTNWHCVNINIVSDHRYQYGKKKK